MEYQKRSVNGDAGEHLVAYRVTRALGWPCRLLDVDIGVDAEMEVVVEGKSTGDFIKIQIKSFDSISGADAKNVYIRGQHLQYWKRCSVPVVVCCVDLHSEKVFWKPIIATDSYASGGEANVVRFDLANDELQSSSASSLRALVTPEESKQIEPLFEQLRMTVRELTSLSVYCVEGSELAEVNAKSDVARAIIQRIRELQQHFPWRVGMLRMRELSSIEWGIVRTESAAARSYAAGLNGM